VGERQMLPMQTMSTRVAEAADILREYKGQSVPAGH
jgi:hypothetical protein